MVPPGRSDLGAGDRRVNARALAVTKEEEEEDRCKDNVGRHNGRCQDGFFGSDGYGGQRNVL